MIQKHVTKDGQDIWFEPNPKWVRVMFGGQFIADSKRVYLLRPGGPPYYYFPKENVRMDLLQAVDLRWSPKFGQVVKSRFCSYNEYGIGTE